MWPFIFKRISIKITQKRIIKPSFFFQDVTFLLNKIKHIYSMKNTLSSPPIHFLNRIFVATSLTSIFLFLYRQSIRTYMYSSAPKPKMYTFSRMWNVCINRPLISNHYQLPTTEYKHVATFNTHLYYLMWMPSVSDRQVYIFINKYATRDLGATF